MFIYIENVWVYTALNLMTLLGQTAFTMLIWALVSDCLDYSEWKTGFRSDGSMYSMYTFSRKIGSTIASSGLAFSLGLVGYVSGENVVQTGLWRKDHSHWSEHRNFTNPHRRYAMCNQHQLPCNPPQIGGDLRWKSILHYL